MDAYQALENTFNKLNDLDHLRTIASWDEAVMMPSGGARDRTKALSTLHAISHQILTDPKINAQIAIAKTQSLNHWQQANLRWIEKLHLNASCLPTRLVQAITESCLQTEHAWRQYRAENNWQAFLPLLEKNIALIKESAQIRAEKFNLSPYDVLLNEFIPGMSQQKIDPIFAILKAKLPTLIPRIVAKQQQSPHIPLQGPFPIQQQKQLGLSLMQILGFNFQHGRLDVSHHPFCSGVPTDVRLTTRYNENEFISAIMGICHETGHAIYEQQLPKEWSHQPVGRAHCMAIHESQSLLLEMQVCRSVEFIRFLSPLLEKYFTNQPAFTVDNMHLLCTRVKPSLIRVDADEVTYPLHIILRYEIEKALFNNTLSVKDLPEFWDTEMLTLFNLDTRGNYKNGIMQDVHWPAGLFGYFPAYTLGSLAASQFYATALHAHPDLPIQIQQGQFTTLFTWLTTHIHQLASSVNFEQLLQKVTGTTLNPQFFLTHIQQRYHL